MADEVLVFVSDLHFESGVQEDPRRRSFLRFLDAHHGIDRLVIAGDLFQFWFDLGRTIPQGYFDILASLHLLRRSGTQIDYLAGNHDYWRGDFFRRELGIQTHPGPLALDVQGRRIQVLHGDGAGPGDLGYKLLKRVLRSPATVAGARLLHPDLLHALARGSAAFSRAHTESRPADLRRLEGAARQSFARGFDALVMGHVHVQLHRQLSQGELVVIGDWLELRSYVRLEGGRFQPERWKD